MLREGSNKDAVTRATTHLQRPHRHVHVPVPAALRGDVSLPSSFAPFLFALPRLNARNRHTPQVVYGSSLLTPGPPATTTVDANLSLSLSLYSTVRLHGSNSRNRDLLTFHRITRTKTRRGEAPAGSPVLAFSVRCLLLRLIRRTTRQKS